MCGRSRGLSNLEKHSTTMGSMARKLLLLGGLLAACLCLQAQEEADKSLTIAGSLVSRGELRFGGLPEQDGKAESRSNFISERARLSLDFNQPGLDAKLVAQHSGIWGESTKGSFNIYEAWAQLKAPNGLFAKLGRQVLAYDDERIIGSNDWAMAASSHDVLKLGYEGAQHKLHLLFAYNQNPENVNGGNYYTGGAQPYKNLLTGWYHYDLKSMPLGASLLFMNIGMQGGTQEQPKTHFQQLLGTYISYKPERWSVEGSYYRQMGKEEHGIPIQAWMASVKVQVDPTDKYSLRMGYDFLSGDKDFATPDGGNVGLVRHHKIKGFSTVYGSHHQFYGAMDFFYVSAYVSSFTPGLQNLYVGGTWKPMKALSLDASYHYLATATSLQNADKPLGHEVELVASYDISKESKLSAGYSFMGGTKTMEVLKRTSDNRILHWVWLMLTVSPSSFIAKW